MGLRRAFDLLIQLFGHVVQFAVKVARLSLLSVLDQRQLVLGCLKRALHLCLLFLPGLHLRLESFDLIFEVVHVDFHFVFELHIISYELE